MTAPHVDVPECHVYRCSRASEEHLPPREAVGPDGSNA